MTGPAHGTLTLNTDGSFTYAPAAGFAGTDRFTYQAGDRSLTSEPATVVLTVEQGNRAPAASANGYSTKENTPLAAPAPGVLGNDADADGDRLSAQLAIGPTHGTLALNANGSFRYVPAAGFAGTDRFTYRAGDGGLVSGPATVTITVRALPRCLGRTATHVGTARADVLRGSPRADVIVALRGADTVLGRGGHDLVCAGRGNDRVLGGRGNDLLLGGPGNDRLVGGPGIDRIRGGIGRDTR